MSGIFGIINKKGYPIHMEWMNQMAQNLSHRGPDGGGIWMENDVGLGHKLLIITPESQNENLPLHYNKWVITSDARIDNRVDLFKLLGISYNKIAGFTDSLLIIKCFEKWGVKSLDYLIGDFAFAIWDKESKQLTCAVDHTGVRQFHYFESNDFIIFSTEIKTIAQMGMIPKILNENKLKDFLLCIDSAGRFEAETFFKGIMKLMPASILIWQKLDSRIVNYWKPESKKIIQFKDKNDYGLALNELIQQAINDRIRTNYPVGITLSGGLDSSSIACLAAKKLDLQGKALFSASSVLPLKYTGIEEDERRYINILLNQEKNIVPFFVSAENAKVLENLQPILEKTFSPINPFHYMDDALNKSLAENANARVILSGYAGDTTVSNKGNTVLAHLFKNGKIKEIHKIISQRSLIYNKAEWRFVLHDIILKFLPQNIEKLLKKLNGTSPSNLSVYDSFSINKSILSKKELSAIKKIFASKKVEYLNFYDNIWDPNYLWFDAEIETRSSHFKQETVYPFVDKRIIDFLFNIPVELFLSNGWNRGLIRQTMDGILPSEIQYRKDKIAYTPDFQTRLINEKKYLFKLLEKEKENLFLNQFIDLERIIEKLAKVKPAKNWGDSDYTNVSIIFYGISCIIYLKWFNRLNNF